MELHGKSAGLLEHAPIGLHGKRIGQRVLHPHVGGRFTGRIGSTGRIALEPRRSAYFCASSTFWIVSFGIFVVTSSLSQIPRPTARHSFSSAAVGV